MEELSDADRRILTALQRNARVSNQELADLAGMSPSACWRRVRALEASGTIRRYATLLDAGAVGLGFHAMVHVTLARHEQGHVETFIAEVGRRAEVLDCFATAGEADYHLRVLCADLDAYNLFLEGFLFRLPGIAHVRTNLILKNIKQEPTLPL